MSTNDKPTTIVIFGASGDLTHRKLIPALYQLYAKGRLPARARIVGFARREWDDDSFREWLRPGVQEFTDGFDSAVWNDFAPRLHYFRGDLDSNDDYVRLREQLGQLEGGPATRLYYLAIAPRSFPQVIAHLGAADMARQVDGWRNIVIEKPFGRDSASAAQLNDCVQAVFDESQVYRIDHYLGKETAQNILYLRFANAVFEPTWNRNYIDNVQITVAESVDVGHRAGYYDQAGVLRDMFQNHLLQLFTLVAMEPPAPHNATTLRNEKVKVLSATRLVDPDQIVYGQYDGYRDAPGVAEGSRTPTFGALRLCIENWRWQGVPFYLRSGKALGVKVSEITIEFKRPPYRMFGAFHSPTSNVLSLCIQPDEGVHLKVEAKVPDRARETRAVDLEFHYRTSFNESNLPDAYERLLLDALNSDASLFARSDEIELAWRLIDPLLEQWEASDAEPATYPRGTWGPEEADALLARDGRSWLIGCGGHED